LIDFFVNKKKTTTALYARANAARGIDKPLNETNEADDNADDRPRRSSAPAHDESLPRSMFLV
jgi:hypothetical protein